MGLGILWDLGFGISSESSRVGSFSFVEIVYVFMV